MAAKVDQEKCAGCGACTEACPVQAIELKGDKAAVKEADCIECGACVASCPCEAISL